MRCEVLGLVDDHVLAGDGAATDVGEGFDLQDAEVDKFLVRASAAFVFLVETHQEFDVVEDRLHPRAEFFIESTREIAEIAAHREDRAANEQALIELLIHRGHQARSDGQKGFSRSSFSDQRHEFDTRIEQEFEGKALFFVAGLDAPNVLVLGAKGHDGFSVRFDPCKAAVLGIVVGYKREELVGVEVKAPGHWAGQIGWWRCGVVVVGGWWFFGFGEDGLEVFDLDLPALVELVDKSTGYIEVLVAGIQFVDGAGFGFKVFGFKADCVSADTQVGVFADQDRLVFGFFGAKPHGNGEDLAVGVVGVLEKVGDLGVFLGKEDTQGSAALEGDAFFGDIAVLFAVMIEVAGDLAGISSDLVDVFFELIEFFDDIDRDDDVVVGKVEDGVGIVEQDVGIEDEVFDGHAASLGCLGAHLRGGLANRFSATAKWFILGPSR